MAALQLATIWAVAVVGAKSLYSPVRKLLGQQPSQLLETS